MTQRPAGFPVANTPRHFDQIAHEYNESLPARVVAHYLERRVEFLSRLVPPPGPVLDAGCGTGLLLRRLRRQGYHATGIDPSIGMLHQAPPDAAAHLVQASAGDLPFGAGAFPLVVSVATIHHLVSPELVAASVREMVRVTSPGGATVIWDHNPRNPYWPLLMARVPQDQEPTRLVPHTEMIAALRGAPGLHIECLQRGWIPDFAPGFSLPLLGVVERVLEGLPGIRAFSAHNVLVVHKAGRMPR